MTRCFVAWNRASFLHVRRAIADVATDLRFAFRVLRKSLFASATIIVCLGFSVGATGTVFVWTRSVVGNPVPGVLDPDGLVSLRTITSRGDGLISHLTFLDIRDADSVASARRFSEIAAFGIRRFALRTTPGAELRHAEPTWGAMVSANYFEALGVRLVIGRSFLPVEDRAGGNAAVAVISHSLWQRRFGGAPDIRGQRIWLNNAALTIVGVAPPRFTGSISRLGLDIWVPLALQREMGNSEWLDMRARRWLDVFGRLATGASLRSADEALGIIGTQLSARYAELRHYGLRANTLDVGPIQAMESISAVVLGLSVLVVLIVCSNVANLLLLRSASREHEIAVRLALGAPSGRVVRQLMTESLMLAVGGVLLATGVAAWSRNALNSLAPATPLPLVTDTPFDGIAASVIAVLGLSTIFVFGLAPALKAVRVSVRASLTGGGTRGGTAQGGRLRGTLVSAQFALSLAVLATAGLFIQRLSELQVVDRGFRAPEQVLLATVDFELAGVDDDAIRRSLVERLVERMSALPGVERAAAASFVPLGFLGYFAMDTEVDGYVPQPGESMSFLTNSVSPGYFETMGIPILDGRAIDPTDRSDSRPVIVVNEAFARRFWAGGNAVGQQMRVAGHDVTVVGIAANGKYEYTAALDQPSPPFVYLPFAQWANSTVVMHLRATGDPLALVPTVRRAVELVDSRLTISGPSTLESYSSVPTLPIRLASRVLTVLGIGALILATLGLYAVIGYAVAQQRNEIGIRMALGASPSRIVRHFLRYAALYAGAGAFAGSVLALTIARTLAARMPGMVPAALGGQVIPFLMAVFALGGVAVLAAFVPARGAARVSPTVALRED
jgi:predicted permease